MTGDPRAGLPSVSALLDLAPVQELVARHGHASVVGALRAQLDVARDAVGRGGAVPDPPTVVADVGARLAEGEADRTRGVINASGVVLHTNLGRAPLSAAAVDAMVDVAGPSTVEYDLVARQRSRRGRRAGAMLRDLVGAEDALVVNNGAAALVLALAAVAGGRRVAVSRGELVEIGGSFRLPDVVEAAGVGLVEVGTTNRTRVQDYASAIASDAEVVAVLRVHPSNFRIEGFTERPAAADLARVAHDAGVTMVHDVGSGVLHDDLPVPSSVEPEPSLRTALTDGADVVVASGDKLLGGPQAGLLAGATRVVDACRTHPLARALRVDKLRLAALEATLDAYRRDDVAGLPTWAALSAPVAVLRARAGALVASAAEAGVGAEIVDLEGVVGGGTLPGTTLPSAGIALDGHPDDLAARLGRADPPVVGRVHDGRLVLDLRTVPPDRDDDLQAVLARLAG